MFSLLSGLIVVLSVAVIRLTVLQRQESKANAYLFDLYYKQICDIEERL